MAEVRGRWVAIDTETNGLGLAARVVEVACIAFDDAGTTVDQYETLVNPHGSIGPTWLHGIDPSMIVRAPTFDEVAGSIELMLRDRVHVAHNLAFDTSVLNREFGRLGLEIPPTHRGVCTAAMTQQAFGRRLSLSEACDELEIVHRPLHRAAADAFATKELFLRLSERLGGPPPRRPCTAFPRAWTLPKPAAPARRQRSVYGPSARAMSRHGRDDG